MAAQSYSGSCHCGAVAFTVEVDTSTALKCNCSICTKLGAVWAFAPKAKFVLTSGEFEQGDYQFNKMKLHHTSVASAASKAMPRALRPMARRRSASIFAASRASMSKS